MTDLTDKNSAVFELQSALRHMSKENDRIRPILTPDGIYGEETKLAVKSFQKFVGIPETGIVDCDTWEAVFGKY